MGIIQLYEFWTPALTTNYVTILETYNMKRAWDSHAMYCISVKTIKLETLGKINMP